MKLSILLMLSLLAFCCNFVSALFIPLVTTGAGTAGAVTITASAASVAAGAAVAATAGVLGLGLAALLLSRGGGDEEQHYGYQQTSYHGDHDHHAPSYGHAHRRRRDVDEEEISEIFALVSNVDVNTCGMKLVCYLYQRPRSSLSQKELAIVHLVGENPKPVSPEKLKDPRTPYLSAAILGLRGDKCADLYSTCPLSGEKIHSYLENLQVDGNQSVKDVVRSHTKA